MGLERAVGDENGVVKGEETLVSIELQKLEETEKNRQGGELGGVSEEMWRFFCSNSFSNSSSWCINPALGEISLRRDLTNSKAASNDMFRLYMT